MYRLCYQRFRSSNLALVIKRNSEFQIYGIAKLIFKKQLPKASYPHGVILGCTNLYFRHKTR